MCTPHTKDLESFQVLLGLDSLSAVADPLVLVESDHALRHRFPKGKGRVSINISFCSCAQGSLHKAHQSLGCRPSLLGLVCPSQDWKTTVHPAIQLLSNVQCLLRCHPQFLPAGLVHSE